VVADSGVTAPFQAQLGWNAVDGSSDTRDTGGHGRRRDRRCGHLRLPDRRCGSRRLRLVDQGLIASGSWAAGTAPA
jgi:hypothetical protein